MNTATVALLFLLVLGLGNASAAPQGGISIHLQDAQLYQVLNVVTGWAKVDFVFPQSEREAKVNVNLDNPTLVQVLDAIFQPIGLNYRIDGKQVIVHRP